MPRGRPAGSPIRQNIVEILRVYGKLHGYNIYAIYKAIFPRVTMRSIYYHLKKGAERDEFKVAEIKKEKGSYSWGGEVERIYYALGENAKPKGSSTVKEYYAKARQAAQQQSQGQNQALPKEASP